MGLTTFHTPPIQPKCTPHTTDGAVIREITTRTNAVAESFTLDQQRPRTLSEYTRELPSSHSSPKSIQDLIPESWREVERGDTHFPTLFDSLLVIRITKTMTVTPLPFQTSLSLFSFHEPGRITCI